MNNVRSFLKGFFIFLAITSSAYSKDALSWDALSDQQIQTCLTSKTFQNIEISYSYDHNNWELRLIFNPKYEKIEKTQGGSSSLFRFYYGVFSRQSIPAELQDHLKEIIKGQFQNSSGGFWSIGSMINGKPSIDYFADAKPTPEIEQADSDIQDEAILQNKQKCAHLDLEVYDLLKSTTFKKLSLDYVWEEQVYPVHFLYNPMREPLFSEGLPNPVRWPLAIAIDASSYPLAFVKHIRTLIPDDLFTDRKSMIDVMPLRSSKKYPIAMYKVLGPILLLNQIENSEVDAEIRELFRSDQLAKKSLYYELNNEFYRVCLIHNPEKLSLKSTLSFNNQEFGTSSHTVSWDSKVGIFVDKTAPEELIDHICQFYDLSWWDRCFNRSIHNGDKVSISIYKGSSNYTYSPYSYYSFMLHAEP